MNVFAWAAGRDGCLYYRLVLPLVTLSDQGLIDVDIKVKMPMTDNKFVPDADVIVGQRLMRPDVVGLWERLAEDGRFLVAEHDDDLFNVRTDNPAWIAKSSNWPSKETWDKEWIPAMSKALSVSSLVTVTNEHLAEQFRQHTDAPIAILPNYIDAALLDVPVPVREPGEHLKVGWAGSPTHDKDFKHNAQGISYGLKKIKDAEMVFIGTDYRSLIDYKRSSFRGWNTDMGRYFGTLTDLHIGLAPLADDIFNRSKSYIKCLEYASLGIPVIASAVGPYLEFVEDGVSGFLCRSETDWMKAIRLLGSDEDLRREMGLKARLKASEHTIQKNAYKWLDVYKNANLSMHS